MGYLKNHPVSWVAVLVLLAATWFEHYWVWGSLFLWWAYTSFVDGQAFIVEMIDWEENPPLFYVTITMWAGLGIYYIVLDFAWRFFGIYIS